jgi:PKD repeat protein
MKTRCFYFVIFGVVLNCGLIAQSPDTLWTKTFGGEDLDCSRWVEQTSDNGYIIAGETRSYGSGDSDVLLIKTDEFGLTEWVTAIGGNDDDYGYCVQQTLDNGYIITGAKGGYSSDLYLIKTDSVGDTLWTKAFNRHGGSEIGYSIKQTEDEGYIITGQVNPHSRWATYVWLIKTDSNGNIDWQKDFGDLNGTCPAGYSVQQTSDLGYILLGNQYNYEREVYDTWLIKTNNVGDSLWTKKFFTNTINDDYGRSVLQTQDNGYIISGYSSAPNYNTNIFLIKTDDNGVVEWDKTFTKFQKNECFSVQQTYDGGYFLTGQTYSVPSANFIYLVKTDIDGNLLWDKEIANSILNYVGNGIQTSDNSFIISGATNHEYPGDYADAWLIKLDSEFKPEFSANTTTGYFPSLEVDFVDESGGNPITWSWDFQNDGIYDSFVQNPTFIYTDVGVYDVKLKISNEAQVDSLIKFDYITVELIPPAQPKEVQIEIIDSDVLISWTEVDTTIFGSPFSPDGYIILHNETLDDDSFLFLDFTTQLSYTHSYVIQHRNQMFYKVYAYINFNLEQVNYLETLRNSHEKVKWSNVQQILEHNFLLKDTSKTNIKK